MIGNWFDPMGQSTAERVIGVLVVIAVAAVCAFAGALAGVALGWIML